MKPTVKPSKMFSEMPADFCDNDKNVNEKSVDSTKKDIATDTHDNSFLAEFISIVCDSCDIDYSNNTTALSIGNESIGWHFNTCSEDTWENWGTEKDSRWQHVKSCCMKYNLLKYSIDKQILARHKDPMHPERRANRVTKHIVKSFLQNDINTFEKINDFKRGLHSLQDMFAHLPDVNYSLQDADTILKNILLGKIRLKQAVLEEHLELAQSLIRRITQRETLSTIDLQNLKTILNENHGVGSVDILKKRQGFVEQATNLYLEGKIGNFKEAQSKEQIKINCSTDMVEVNCVTNASEIKIDCLTDLIVYAKAELQTEIINLQFQQLENRISCRIA